MRPIRWLFLLLPSLLFALGCAKESATPGAQGSPKAPTVSVSTPVTRAVTEYEEFTGMTQAMQTIEVRARVSGYLSKIYFKNKEGAVVKKDAFGTLNFPKASFRHCSPRADIHR